ncbi:ABC transporter permease [Profundibacterium mesophilum]|uniref:ABC oligodipeptide transporter inner membrane subunit n=1 Tax=Profundibacterium mesophilum KAUST100406-0324 TaxID=1037889 RepID=A0A921NUU5_9RHOB|nr:ABC transporter permease [Profundibacterium mesophilum]KAF0675204.1 ABC oligodipeptide transporter inner membrane subunit [Profundibacterium mesophilum KAUST100406-0324]
MILFILRRVAMMLLTALCLTFIVFWLTNLPPNLEKLAKSAGNVRMGDEQVASWLEARGHLAPLPVKYGRWLGVLPAHVGQDAAGRPVGRCLSLREARQAEAGDDAPDTEAEGATAARYCGILQGDWGRSTVFRQDVTEIIATRLALTGKLMGWVLVLMVPSALLIGVLAGIREGSRSDRALSTVSIVTTATPEYVSGVILIAVFASSAGGLKWLKGTASSAMENATFENFFLPVLTISLFGMGYIARMTRASMAEVMTAQYIRTARLKGLGFGRIVLVHALRNALIAPFTVIMLQIPWLLNGVVIVETLFSYKGFGWTLVEAAGNNDIDLLLGVSVVSVVVVLATQLISDIGYAWLNPRIAVS